VHASWSEHEDIGADEIAVLAVLSTYADRNGWCGVGQTTLGGRLKRSRSWTNKVLQRLDDAGVIRIEQLRDRGRIVGCRYLIRDHAGICNDQASQGGESDGAAAEAPAPPGFPITGAITYPINDSIIGQVSDPVANHVAERHTESPRIHPEPLSPRVNAAGEGEKSGEGRPVGQTPSALAPPPADWLPDADDLAYAARHRPDLVNRLAAVTQKFIHATRSRGQHFADISAAWRCWVLRERTCHDHDPQPGNRPHARADRPAHTGIAARNRDTARDCLERILARRGGRQSA
jgi:hypothetical protein